MHVGAAESDNSGVGFEQRILPLLPRELCVGIMTIRGVGRQRCIALLLTFAMTLLLATFLARPPLLFLPLNGLHIGRALIHKVPKV